ncbi:MAG: universal stress protein [Anaerolineae bacterium]
MKVLIPYDGSSSADAAILDLLRAGLPEHVEAVVLSVADVWMPPTDDEPGADLPDDLPVALKMARAQAAEAVEEARTLAMEAACRVCELFPTWKVEAESVAEAPAWAIIKKVEDWKADLVVLGSHGRTALSQFILGTVAQKVLTEVHCSVRIARPSHPDPVAPVRIVLGMDGSPGADEALRTVAEREWPDGSEVLIVASADSKVSIATAPFVPPGAGWVHESDESTHGWIHSVVDGAAGDLRRAGLGVSQAVRDGDPREILVAEAARWDADCIFVGASGLTRLGYLVLGSISTAVAARAGCSVEVVRPAPHSIRL